MCHPRRWVFLGAVAALALMTLLSVLVGQVVTLLPQQTLKWAEVSLFAFFGVKLLYQASRMSPTASASEEKEVADAVVKAEQNTHRTFLTVIAEAFGLIFIAEWCDGLRPA